MKIKCLQLLGILICCLSFAPTYAQEKGTIRSDQLSLYINCACDLDYIRLEIPYMSYRQERRAAHIHLQILTQEAGFRSLQYNLKFWGQKEFEGQDQELVFTTNSNMTKDEIRINLVKVIKAGLVPYLSQTTAIDQVDISYDSGDEIVVWTDRFKNWTFGVDGLFRLVGDVHDNDIPNRTNLDMYMGIRVSKLTPDWRFNALIAFDRAWRWSKGSETMKLRSNHYGGDLVATLGDHWAFGGVMDIDYRSNSTSRSNEWIARVGPKIEFNIFPYEEFIRNEFRINYIIRYNYAGLFRRSIGQLSENENYSHRLGFIYRIIRKWGDLSAIVYVYQGFRDLSIANTYMNVGMRKRLGKGIFLNIKAIAQTRFGQENLSRLSYTTEVGVSYLFGSLHNNVVNPRRGF